MLLYLKICQKKNLTQYFVLSVDTENLYEVANEATIFIVVIIGKIISKIRIPSEEMVLQHKAVLRLAGR